ncbi:MAG: GAF domain-containing protein, partial [Nitrospinota bacterium]
MNLSAEASCTGPHSSCFELEILIDIAKIANSEAGLTDRLNGIVSVIKERTGVDACSILLLDDEKEHLVLKATIGLNEAMINVLRMSLDSGITGWTAKEKKPVIASHAASDYRFLSVPETGEGMFKSALSVPLLVNHHSIGVIYAQTVDVREFGDGEVKLLSLIADQTAGIIRNAQLYEKSRLNLSELLLINEITQAINTTFDLDKLLSLIVKRSTEVVHAKGCAVWIASGESLVPRASYGMDVELFQNHKIEIGEQIIGEAARFSEPKLIRDVSSYPDGSFLKQVCTSSALIVPLTVEKKVIGVLVLLDKLSSVKGESSHFLLYDQNIISLLGGQAAIAIDKAVLYERLERVSTERENKIKELLLLYDISVAMQSTVSLNKIIRIILSCVTVGDLFGFNRAILFLFDEKTHMLNGMMGIGPDGAEEAARVWQSIPKINNLVSWLTFQEDGPPDSGKYFDKFAKELKIPISRDGSILS